MSKIIRVGDTHLRRIEPFRSAFIDLFEWISKNDELNNSENYLIHLGDVFDKSIINGEENLLVLETFKNLKFKHIYICRGNHSISSQAGDATRILDSLENVTVLRTPTKVTIENENFLFLPYYYSNMENLPPMREYYNDLPDEFKNDSYDELIYHCEDETNTIFQNNPINLSYLKTKRRTGGHIHRPNKNFLGTPYITRYDEKGKDSFLKIYDTDTGKDSLLPIPKLIDYYSFIYGEEVPETDAKYPIFDISKCPTSNIFEIKERYNVFIRELYKEEFSYITKGGELTNETVDLSELFTNYMEDNNFSESLKNYLKELGVNNG